MRIHAGEALKSPGTPFDFECEQIWRGIDFAGDHVDMIQPVTIKGTYYGQSETVIVRGLLETVVRMQCGRCLKSFERPLGLEFCEEFYQGPFADEREGYPFEGDWIDLTEMAEINMVTGLPVKKLCSQHCPGLCAVCGHDLSQGACDCAGTEPTDGFKSDLRKLKALLQDDKEV